MAKPFILTDESLNVYGFWIKTDGLDWSLFDNNPIMLFQHIRPGDYENKGKDMLLPLGCWKDRKKENGVMMATPEFDQDDDFAKKIEKKVDKGIIRMASLGIQPLQFSEDPKDLKPGQTRPTVLKGLVKEASIVDLGGNYNALRLYDESGQLITLSSDPAKCAIPLIKQTQNSEKMTKINGLLKLADDANEAEQYQAIVKLNEKISGLESEKTRLEGDVLKLKQTTEADQKARIKTMLDGAVKDRKILESQRADYETLADKDFDNTKKIIDAMPVMTKLVDEGKGGKKSQFEGKTWDQLDKAGQLADLKLEDPTRFKEMYKEKFGTEYKG